MESNKEMMREINIHYDKWEDNFGLNHSHIKWLIEQAQKTAQSEEAMMKNWMENNLLMLFHLINNNRSKELQFSDYRLEEMIRDICDLFNMNINEK